MIEKLEEIKKHALDDINECSDEVALNNVKSKYVGKKSVFNEIMAGMSSLSNDEKREVGSKSNEVRNLITEALDNRLKTIKEEELNRKLNNDKIDITLPSRKRKKGTYHPLTLVRQEMEDLFISMGYDVVDGPEVETDKYCFEMLNLPKDHPARDAQDSFYITDEILLRTQTSAVQIRSMLANTEKKPFKLKAYTPSPSLALDVFPTNPPKIYTTTPATKTYVISNKICLIRLDLLMMFFNTIPSNIIPFIKTK